MTSTIPDVFEGLSYIEEPSVFTNYLSTNPPETLNNKMNLTVLRAHTHYFNGTTPLKFFSMRHLNDMHLH